MKLERVQPGDIIKASIKGRTGIWGEVTEIKSGMVYFRPLCPATGWRHASAREIVGHWRSATRRPVEDRDGDRTTAAGLDQLSIPGIHT